MLLSKVVKNQSIDFNGCFNLLCYKQIYNFIDLKYLGTNAKIVDNAIKIVAYLFHKLIPLIEGNCLTKEQKEGITELDNKALVKRLVELFQHDYKMITMEKERIVNNMSLMISITTVYPEMSEGLRPIVKNIIDIAKEMTDVLRKNAAILLAKIAKSSDEMQNYVRELHGMDVLLNVAKFIKVNK
jgi:hypothetical protein